MKISYLFLWLVIIMPFTGRAQSSWVRKLAVPIHTDSAGNFSNLSVLNPYWAKAQIIALGEQTHFDGATFDAKVQLVKYLHEQLGFNVLAFESGYYECSRASELITGPGSARVLQEAVFGVWDTRALADLEAYIQQTRQTGRPLKVTGFDFQFSGTLAAKYFIPDLEKALSQLGAGALMNDPQWSNFKSAAARQIRYSNFYKKPAAADTTLIGSMTRKIREALEVRKGASAEAARLVSFWQRACDNLAFDSRHRHMDRNYRDSLMAENLLGLSAREFAGEKVICWNATSHFIFNPRLIASEAYSAFIPMGDYLHRKLGDKLFTIGFTSLQGKAGSVVKYTLKPAPITSIEYALGTLNMDYGFIGFSGEANDPSMGAPVETRMLGNKFLRMPLPRVVNGLFYIREAYPPR